MSDTANKKSAPKSWGLIALMIVFVVAAVYIVKMVLSEDGPHKKSSVTTVTLLKPPPPVTVKEKPPEEIKQVDKKIEQTIDTPQDQPKGPENDNTPAGDKLGLDAEGRAGGDAFGLAGKKGGRSLLAGGDGMGRLSLLSKFAGYNRKAEAELRKKIMKRLDEEGGIPKGKLQAVVRISLDTNGAVVKFRIIGSSGNNRMDDAIKDSLGNVKISEPPPDGMPKTMDIKIASQG
jgi:protein TonB